MLGKLTSSKWARLAKCSEDMVHRDVMDLVKRDILARKALGGLVLSGLASLPPLPDRPRHPSARMVLCRSPAERHARRSKNRAVSSGSQIGLLVEACWFLLVRPPCDFGGPVRQRRGRAVAAARRERVDGLCLSSPVSSPLQGRRSGGWRWVESLGPSSTVWVLRAGRDTRGDRDQTIRMIRARR
jgi:hypothetical protein